MTALLARLSLQQKIRLLGGDGAMSTLAEPAIGLPKLKMSDGPMGVQSWGNATAFASGIGLAATWDNELAQEVGEAMGEDARARGVHFLLGPGLNIYRSPLNGRNFEYFGEDPYLAAQMGLGYIRGVQSQQVVATAKHFLGNNSEYDRRHANAIIDERTLHEIYLPAFETAVREGKVGAIMAAFNPVNGMRMTENAPMNNDLLKKQWQFNGLLMSDWDATQGGVAAANGGTDLEMPFAKWMNEPTLLSAVRDGRVKEQTIDDKVRRLLRVCVTFGFLDREQADLGVPLYNTHADAVALRNAEESIVLLKNDQHLLPLDKAQAQSISILGPGAFPAHTGAGGSSDVVPFAPVSLLTGVAKMASPGARIFWSEGIKSPSEIFASTNWCADAACKVKGLTRTEYVESTHATLSTTIDEHINQWTGDEWATAAGDRHRVEWEGFYLTDKPGPYRFVAGGIGEDRYQLEVDGKPVLEETRNEGQPPLSAVITLSGAHAYRIQFTYWPMTDHVTAGLGALPEDRLINPEAVRLATMSSVVLLSLGFDDRSE